MSAERDKETILNDAEKAIGRTSGKVLRTTFALSFVLTACSTAVTPKNPEATQEVEPTATVVIPIPTETEEPTLMPTGTPTPIPTLEPSPTVEPTQIPEIKVSDITDEVRIFSATGVMGERRLIPFGITKPFHRFSSSEEGAEYYFLSGILLEKPHYDGNAFVVFRLGIPDFSQGKFRELYYKSPVGVSREGELGYGLTPSIRNIAYGGFDLRGGTSRSYSLEEATELCEKSIGRQIVFVLEVGITEKHELEYLESILERFGSWDVPSRHAFELLISQAHENYEVFTYLLNGNPAYEGKEFGAFAGNRFVPWSSLDWK